LGLETDEDAKVNINDDRTSKFLSQHKSNVSTTQSPLKKQTPPAPSSASTSTTAIVKTTPSQNVSDTIAKEKKESKSKSNVKQKTTKKKNKKSKDADDDDDDDAYDSVPSQEGTISTHSLSRLSILCEIHDWKKHNNLFKFHKR
jgi:hypothetical protein